MVFLSAEELIVLTGYKIKSGQCRWLTVQNIPYKVNAAGYPLVPVNWDTPTQESIFSWYRKNYREFDKPLDVIAATKITIKDVNRPSESGVYFLFKGSDLIYVGMAKNIDSRIEQHLWPMNKPSIRPADWFDGIAWILAHVDIMERVESYYINKLKPPRNVKAGRFTTLI